MRGPHMSGIGGQKQEVGWSCSYPIRPKVATGSSDQEVDILMTKSWDGQLSSLFMVWVLQLNTRLGCS